MIPIIKEIEAIWGTWGSSYPAWTMIKVFVKKNKRKNNYKSLKTNKMRKLGY